MEGEAVSITLEPHRPRQLGEDGLVVFWRDAHGPGGREGLACTLSVCPHAGCAGELVYVDGFVIDGPAASLCWDPEGVHLEQPAGESASRVTLEGKMVAIVDPSSGEIEAHPDLPGATDPALLGWLASELDGEVLEVLHRFRASATRCRPEGPLSDIDIDAVEEFHLTPECELLEGTRSDEYILGGRRYWVGMFLCPTPGCDCHEARLVFFDDEADPGDDVGSVLLHIGGPSGFEIEERTAASGSEELLAELWARFTRRHDVGRLLRRREAQLKEVGATLWHSVARQMHVVAKIGRNAPCPCGSGRKHKKCCLGRSAAPPGPRSHPGTPECS